MTKDLKYPVPHLLPKRAKKLRKLRATAPHLERWGKDADAMAKLLFPAIKGEMKSHLAETDGEDNDPTVLSAERHAKTLGINQAHYRGALNLIREGAAKRPKTVFEAVTRSKGLVGFTNQRITDMLLDNMSDGWAKAGFRDDFTGVSVELIKPASDPDASSRHIKITFKCVPGKRFKPGDYVYIQYRNSTSSYTTRPDLWEMYRALKIPQGFTKPFCSLPGPDQHRLLFGVVNVFSIPLPQGAIVVQCEFIDRRNKGTRDRGVRQGYMVFHPEVPFYGYGWTAKKAVSDMQKSMGKRLTEIVRQSST